MSANDILDVLNIQREETPQPKKKQKVERYTGLARELYSLIGPNTPPIALGSNTTPTTFNKKPSPWSKIPLHTDSPFTHWVKGSKELHSSEPLSPYFFNKFNVKLDIPQLPEKETYIQYITQIKADKKLIRLEKLKKERLAQEAKERKEKEAREKAKDAEKGEVETVGETTKEEVETVGESKISDPKVDPKETEVKEEKEKAVEGDKDVEMVDVEEAKVLDKKDATEDPDPESETKPSPEADVVKKETVTEENNIQPDVKDAEAKEDSNEIDEDFTEDLTDEFSYDETKYLFNLCSDFELKWPIVFDRYFYRSDRTLEDLKEHFYAICVKILENKENSNPALIESLKVYSKSREVERIEHLETLLKRSPAEIAEEESLVIEARRFELAAKKMLLERSNLLTLLDSPQTTQSISAYQSSQGLANLYNHLLIADKNQKKRQLQQQQRSLGGSSLQYPITPPIPNAASSSFKKDRNFQTHLQNYLSGLLKNQNSSGVKPDATAIQQLLQKRLTQKEEEAYGLHYHATERLTPGVTLRSAQRISGLQQKQSVLKLVNSLLQELDIPTAGGTNWKPKMPTRKTMAKYDELIKAVVALLDVKRGKDKLEAEIRLIKSQRGLQ